MLQQGQVFKLTGGTEEKSLWAYRFRVGGRGSRRVQRGGFASEQDASEALERALERVRREQGCGTALTLAELVDVRAPPEVIRRGSSGWTAGAHFYDTEIASRCVAWTRTPGSAGGR